MHRAIRLTRFIGCRWVAGHPWTLALYLVALLLQGCSDPGRVAVILDTSISMSSTTSAGATFADIKRITLATLGLIPKSNQIGLRIFSGSASSLLAPYSHDLTQLQHAFATVEPAGGTYIGPSLLDAATDLASFTSGPVRLYLFTDGLGDESDVSSAFKARSTILANRSDFECAFIVFNAHPLDIANSLIGRAAAAMGCAVDTPGRLTESSLLGAMTRVFSQAFFPIWLLISAILYVVLVALTSSMVFASTIAAGGAPRRAMLSAGVFLISMLLMVLAAHTLGLFVELGVGALAFLAGLAILATAGSVLSDNRKRKNGGRRDPFDSFS